MASKAKFFEKQIEQASPGFQKEKAPDEYTPVAIPSGKKSDGSVDASTMKARFELLANPPPKTKTRGAVAWDDNRNQGGKKVHKPGYDPTKPPPPRSLADLP
ncbi:WH2 motif domain containing protein [Balamuthia mandrillaris]